MAINETDWIGKDSFPSLDSSRMYLSWQRHRILAVSMLIYMDRKLSKEKRLQLARWVEMKVERVEIKALLC